MSYEPVLASIRAGARTDEGVRRAEKGLIVEIHVVVLHIHALHATGGSDVGAVDLRGRG